MHVSWMGGAELLQWFQQTATEDFMLVPLAGGSNDRRFFREFEREGDRLHLLSGDSVAVVLLGALPGPGQSATLVIESQSTIYHLPVRANHRLRSWDEYSLINDTRESPVAGAQRLTRDFIDTFAIDVADLPALLLFIKHCPLPIAIPTHDSADIESVVDLVKSLAQLPTVDDSAIREQVEVHRRIGEKESENRRLLSALTPHLDRMLDIARAAGMRRPRMSAIDLGVAIQEEGLDRRLFKPIPPAERTAIRARFHELLENEPELNRTIASLRDRTSPVNLAKAEVVRLKRRLRAIEKDRREALRRGNARVHAVAGIALRKRDAYALRSTWMSVRALLSELATTGKSVATLKGLASGGADDE